MQQIKDPENKAYWQKYKLFIIIIIIIFLNSNIQFMVSGNWWVKLLKKAIAT
jgi:hypothetical protein